MRILLVEDNSDDAEVTRLALERAKIVNPVTVIDNGESALDFLYRECADRNDPSADMVLLDLGLPKVDGWNVLRQIWEDKRLRHIPVVVLTGSARDDDLVRAYKGGAVAFLRKPVEVERLLNAISELHEYRLLIVHEPAVA